LKFDYQAMAIIFVHIFRFFSEKKWLAILIFTSILCLSVFYAFRIHFSEDISQLAPGKNNKEYSMVLKNLKFTDKLFINISLYNESTIDPESLSSFANKLTDSLTKTLYPDYISNITKELPPEMMAEVYSIYYNNLPIFMLEQDYNRLDSLLTPEGIKKTLENNYRSLISPAGMIFKQYITADPFSIAGNSLKRLQSFQLNNNYDVYNGYVFTKDKKHLLLIISTSLPPSETSGNTIFIKSLDHTIRQLTSLPEYKSKIKAEYFGAAAVAVANASQIKKDIILTVSMSLLIILLFVGWFFRSASIPLVSFLPALFGGSTSLALIFFIRHSISAIALGIGSVLLGIIVDYAIYMYNLYRIKKDTEVIIRDLAFSILLCAFSSAAAFFSLLFVQSKVLQDLGLFAGLSVIMASVFTVLFLPLLLQSTSRKNTIPKITWVDKITSIEYHKSRILFYGILLLAIIFYFLSSKVKFEDNLNSMNYTTSELDEAEKNLNKSTGAEFKPVYFVTTGKTLSEALKLYERYIPQLNELQRKGVIEIYSGIDKLIVSDSLQKKRITEWSQYWTKEKKDDLRTMLTIEGAAFKFRAGAFNEFYNLIDKEFQPVDISKSENIRTYFLADRIVEKPDFAMVVTILRIAPHQRDVLFTTFKTIENVQIIDRQMITNQMVISVRDDFHLLVNLCMILVSAVLIFAYGRIELGIIASLPMFLSWYITLGMILLLGLKFNIINIIVCTFIFGLGVDYSVLMMRGLLHEYKTGVNDLRAYKNAIFISAFTTFIGVGVLIFAKHPALRSIALVSMIGVVSVVIITYTTIPVMFNWLINNKNGKRPVPVTFFRLIGSIISYTFYFLFCFLILIIALLLKLVPIDPFKKKLFVRYCSCYFSRWTIFLMFMAGKKIDPMPAGLVKNPAVIISNHQSLIDIPLTLMVSPKVVLVPSERVWNSKFTGWLIKLAGYYPTNIGYDLLIEKFRKEIAHGNSIILFPEGTRTSASSIKRFHKGAFYIAEQLHVDILPMIVQGSSFYVPKGEWVGNRSRITVRFLPRIKADDKSFGETYQERTGNIQNLFRTEFNNLKSEYQEPGYYKRKLINSYVFKGPVLEWYLRVKLMLDHNYQLFNKYASLNGQIVDIGCGYGFISYMLYFISDSRKILGIDSDADKIAVANNCITKTPDLEFICADIVAYPLPLADTFVLCDVLHYIPIEQQKELIMKCIANLNAGGSILIRDGDSSLAGKHQRTKFTEFFSTNIGFNKAQYKDLEFPDRHMILEIAQQYGFSVEIVEDKKYTSNVLFVLRKQTV
jgi:uncharacterized protein